MTTSRAVLLLVLLSLGAPAYSQEPPIGPPELPPLHVPVPRDRGLQRVSFEDLRAQRPARLLGRLAQQPRQQEEFTPISELPPQEQLSAAPLLISAYAFVLLMLFAYIVSISRRLTGIQGEIDRLEADLKAQAKR